MKRVKIWTDTKGKRNYEKAVLAKILLFERGLKYCEGYAPIKDKRAFYDNFLLGFEKAFKSKYSDKFPDLIPVEKQIELTGIDLEPLRAIHREFIQNKTVFNPKNLEPTLPEFDTYITNPEEIERYEACKDFIAAIERLSKYATIRNGLMVQATTGAININWEDSSKLTHSAGWIQNIKNPM